MADYLKDIELIKAICSKRRDKLAEFQLIERYRKDAFFVAKNFYDEHKKSGITVDEYNSVALAAIVPAAKKYKLNLNVRFIYFYKAFVTNCLRDYDKANSYLRDARMFAGNESLDAQESGKNPRLKAEEFGDIDPLIKGRVDVQDILDVFKEVLKVRPLKHRIIYSMFINNCSIKYIATTLKVPLSTVYRVIEEVSSEIKKLIAK